METAIVKKSDGSIEIRTIVPKEEVETGYSSLTRFIKKKKKDKWQRVKEAMDLFDELRMLGAFLENKKKWF